MGEQQTLCRNCGSEVSGARFCSECGTATDVPTVEQTLQMNGPPPSSGPAANRASAQQHVEESDTSNAFRLRVVVGVVLVLAIVGVGLGLAGFLQAQSAHSQGTQLRSQLAGVRHQLQTAQGTIANLKASSQIGAVTALKSQTGTLQTQMGDIATCVPELQQQINGLNVQTQFQSVGGTDYLTGAFLQNPTVTSSNCNKVLNGH
jgi:uncharacterized protein HemX